MTNIEQKINNLQKQINCLKSETCFFNSNTDFPAVGEVNRLYVDKGANSTYIWDGDEYVILQISGNEYRFGFTGEDDTATETRLFNGAGFPFSMIELGEILLQSNESMFLESAGFSILSYAANIRALTNLNIISEDSLGIDIPSKGNIGDVLTSVDVNGTTEWKPIIDVANDFVDDAAAALGGVPVGGVYHNAGDLKVRLV